MHKSVPCQICHKRSQPFMLQHLHQKYFNHFNFYFAKPVNEILNQITTAPHYLYYKEYLLFDENTEYLKRIYSQSEVKPRMEILSEFYNTNYKKLHPNLMPIQQYQLIQKHDKKLDKLYYQKMQETQKNETQTIQALPSQVLRSSDSHISFESEEHDIFQEHTDKELKIPLLDLKQINENDLSDILTDQIVKVNMLSFKKKQLAPHFYKQIHSPISSQQTIKTLQQVRRRNKERILPANSSSKHSQSSFKDEEERTRIRQLRCTISQEHQGFQGSQKSQKSMRLDGSNSNLLNNNTSIKQEQLKKAYCLTDRSKVQRPEFNYMLPSQYNTNVTLKTTQKTKSHISKGSHHSQSKLTIQRADDIVKKYIQMATQTMQNNKKKFDFKLNLVDEDLRNALSKRLTVLTERHSMPDREHTSHRKIVIKQ